MTTVSADFESILEKYKIQKLNTYKVVELLGDNYIFEDMGADVFDKRYAALINCGTQLTFSKSDENGKTVYHLKAANFCRQRCCPMCQFRRSEKMFAQMLRVVKHLEGQYRFLHLVLTIPNQRYDYELVQGVKLLYKGFSNLLKYKQVRGAFKGILRCLEVSYNYDNDTFHPHLHCLVAVNRSYFNDSRKYLSYDLLRELWTEAVKKAVRSSPENFSFINESTPLLQIHVGACKEGDYSGVAEVCKYSLKPLDLEKSESDDQNKRVLLTLWHTLKGARFVQKYGIIRDTWRELFGENEKEELTDEKAEGKTLFLQWNAQHLEYWSD